jgi:molybdopterin-binding protein
MLTQKKQVKIEMPQGCSVSSIIADRFSVKVMEESEDTAWIILEEKPSPRTEVIK